MMMTKTMTRTMTVALAVTLLLGLVVASGYGLRGGTDESAPTAATSSPSPESDASPAAEESTDSSADGPEDSSSAATPEDSERSPQGREVAPGRDGSLPSITPLRIERRPRGMPKPAAQVAESLCNLTRGYLGGLRDFGIAGGAPGAELRDATMVLGDQVSVWVGLASSFPQFVPDIERASLIRDLWQEAAIAEDNGDTARAEAAIAAADEQIAQLPPRIRAGGLSCR